MKILILIQIFETFNDTGSDRHYYFAKKLVEQGHDVEVITANIDYKNAKKRFQDTGVVKKNIDGIKINYVPVYSKFRGSFSKRMIFFFSYFLSSIYTALKASKVNIIYSISTPLTVGLLGSIISFIKRVPMVFEVTDVWPDAAMHTKVIKSKNLISLAKMVEKICYKNSSKIICLSKGIQSNIVNKGIPIDKTTLIPNGVDFSLFKSIDKDSKEIKTIKKKYNLDIHEQHFIAMYLGAHGAYNSLFTIVEAARNLTNFSSIKVIFVGDGDEKIKLQRYVSENNLNNVNFIGTVNRKESVKILGLADIFLLPNRKGGFFECNLPNKLFDYLASAKPIVVAGQGETSDVIGKSNAGLVVDAEDADAFSSSIIKLFNLPKEERIRMGKSGKDYVSSNFDRKMQFLSFINTLQEAANN